MKKQLFTIAFALVAFFAVNTSQAQSGAHFTDVVFDGLTVTGKVAGLGNRSGDVEVIYTSGVSVTRFCINPGGQIADEKTQTLPMSGGEGDELVPGRNGRVEFTINITPTQNDVDLAFDPCTEGKGEWTFRLEESAVRSLTFTTANGASGSYTFE